MENNEIITGKELESRLVGEGYSGEVLEETIEQIDEINKLKQEKNAVILAHYYMINPLKEAVADYVGDSLELSKAARDTDADIILFAGVHFMAESAKILSPNKTVLIPDLNAGCSLAESINAKDVRELRERYPDAAIVGYINTSAEVKAELDITVTSANVKKIIEQLPQEQIVYLPDRLMAQNLRNEVTGKEIIDWEGTCIVHEAFTPEYMDALRKEYEGIKILAHPECSSDVTQKADFMGSTSGMLNYVREHGSSHPYFLATECGLAGTIQSQMPEVAVVGSCSKCPYMKMITVENTLDALRKNQFEVNVKEQVIVGAKKSLDKMLEMS